MKTSSFVTASRAMREVESFLPRIAASTAPVVIEGETGAGKGRIAQAIHEMSPRRGGPFEVLSCGAIAESLADSEFFGHARGAYTHAFEAQSGRLERANGGTLVLDHVEDLALSVQAKLLRAIEEGTVQRLGESLERPVDVRYVATSRGPLRDAIALKTFRDDLYHRLAVITLSLPPLRDRREDILPLARTFLAVFRAEKRTQATDFSENANRILEAYPWPGNARELQSAVERAVLRHEGAGAIDASSLPTHLLNAEAIVRSFGSKQPTLKELERAYILWVLESVGGVRAEAARTLGISRKSLWEKCKRFGIA